MLKLQYAISAEIVLRPLKNYKKDSLSEDACKDAEKDIQDVTDKFISLIEKHLAAKRKRDNGRIIFYSFPFLLATYTPAKISIKQSTCFNQSLLYKQHPK